MNILFYLWEVFIFVLLTGWLVLLPGLYLTGFLRIPLTRIEKLSVSLAAGICGLTLLLYIFGSLNARFLVYVIVSLVSLFWLARQSKPWRRRIQNFAWLPLNKNNIFSVFLIISGALASGSILFRSGWQNVGGSLSFTEYRDAFWHLGLMEELVRQIPPLHPGFAPLPLTNYHYFAHLFGASYLFLGVFNNLDFYFRLFPFLLTLLFGLSLYIAGRALTKSVFGANLAVIFGYFTGSFAYVLPLFIRYPGFDWHESSFWLSQPFSMAINPSFALSSFLFLATVFLLTKMSVSPKKELAILITLIGGTLIIYKVYAGALFLGGLLVCSLWDLLKSHKPILIMTFIFSLILSLFLFIPINGKDAGSFLVFLPGWLLRSMVESPDRVQIVDWILRENTYGAAGNTFAILRYRIVELLIYLVGNLGIRILGFGVIFVLIKKLKNVNPVEVFLLSTAFAGLVIPLLFVQNGSIANTVQFSYYSLIIFGLWTAVFLNSFLKKYSLQIKTVVIAVLFLLAIPTSVKLWYGAVFPRQVMGISTDYLKAFNYLKNNTPSDTIIAVPGVSIYEQSLEAGTLSDRRLFYSDRLMAENTHKDFKQRENKLQQFYNSKDMGWNTAFLNNNDINYVFVDKNINTNFNYQYYPLKKIFSNKAVDIYKVL